ncbi:MAG: RHS repeat protein [Ignavibacteria bacterium]|nr:RHS repeat protein [Ignavibacteria bacterium]
MVKSLTFLLLLLLTSLSVVAQKHRLTETVQYVPMLERTDSASLLGESVAPEQSIVVSFAAMPSEVTCGQKCLSRALLVLSFGIQGQSERYMHGRGLFEIGVEFIVNGYDGLTPRWSYSSGEMLEIAGTLTATKPVATMVIDVTQYADLSCDPGSETSNEIVIEITGLDTTGLSSEMIDSLVFSAKLIQEYRILPYPGSTLSCPSNLYVHTDSLADTTHPVRLSWQVKDNVTLCPDLYPSFEVEVLRLYNTSPSNRDSELKTYAKVDWRQAQRFITYGPATHIDFTLAEGTGYYAWRVRPIGNYYPGGIGNEKNWGCWSKAPAQDDMVTILSLTDMDNQQDVEFDSSKPYFYYRQFDRDKNWIFNRSFVEDDGGLTGIAEGITYASRLMQPLQVQTPVTTSGDVLVQQSVLDYEGRPLVSTLAAPKVRSGSTPAHLKYVTNLVTTSSTPSDYRAKHFDNLPSLVSAMSGDINTYWSSSNANKAVPSADSFAFQRTVLSNDPLSRSVEQSAVGSAHKIGSGKTIRTSYGPVSDRELVTMFGKDAPTDTAVSRVATTDQNGVTSVAYVRFDGKTLATALVAGSGNSALLTLNDSSVVNDVVIQDTVRRGTNVDDRRIIAERPLEILTSTSVTFSYFLDPDTLRNECANFCSTCEYHAKVEVIEVSSGEVIYADSLDAVHGECPGVSPSTISEVTHELEPGSYILRRTLTPIVLGPDSTHAEVIKQEVADGHRTVTNQILAAAFNSEDNATDLDRMRDGLHLTDETMARRMLQRYRTYRDSVIDSNSVAYVQADDCCGIVLDTARCKTGCETENGRYNYEAMLFDRWEASVLERTGTDSGRVLSTYVRWYDGSLLLSDVDLIPGGDTSANGIIDSLVRRMVEEGGYNCAELYACWQAVVGAWDATRWTSDTTVWTHAGENIITQFLNCAGTKYCSAAPYSEKITGAAWILNAWKIMPRSPNDSTNATCELALQYDSTWTCSSTDSVEINDKYRQLQQCIAGTDRLRANVDETARLAELAEENNPYYKPVDEHIDSLGVEAYYKGMIDTCQSSCERRRTAFRDSIVRMYNKEGYWVEGHLDRLPVGEPREEVIKSYQLSCMVNMLVAECKDQCSFPIEWDSLDGHPIIIRPNGDDIKEWQEASYATSFRVQRPMEGDTCPTEQWKHVERTVVLADLIVEVLNAELLAYRDTAVAVVSRWNARPIIAMLAAEFPQIETTCLPPADSTNDVDSAGIWTFTVNKVKQSRFFVQRIGSECKIMYEPPAIDAISEPYGPTNPHPLVAILNKYFADNWGKKVSEDILADLYIQETNTTELFHTDDDHVTFYKVRAEVNYSDDEITVARIDDPLKPSMACDVDGLWYPTVDPIPAILSWTMCETETIACINGRTITMSELEEFLRFTSKTKWLVRLSPTDDSLYVVGDLGLSLCDTTENLQFHMWAPAYDSIYNIGMVLPEGMGLQYNQRRFTQDKHAFVDLLNGQNFRDSIGRFIQTPEGKLAFRLRLNDTVQIYTFPRCLDFSCSVPQTQDSCKAIPVCGICDTVNCGTACFRWVYADTLAPTVLLTPKSCAAEEVERLVASIDQQMSECLERKLIEVDVTYDTTCFDPKRINDHFIAERGEKFYHYTLYYYDRAGNLIETVPPAGFRPLELSEDRGDSNGHVMKTTYAYNSIGQLVEQFTPDGGLTRFWYDNVGRLRLSQNARQQAISRHSYTNYDALGRVVEVGQSSSTISDPEADATSSSTTAAGTHRIITTYTGAYTMPIPYGDSAQTHLRNRVSRVMSDQDGDTTTLGDQVKTYYSYDAHGNVKWMVQSLPAVVENTNPLVTYVGYEYDLMSGRVRKVHYRPEQNDAYHQRFTYDHDGRIITCETSKDGIIWAKDASYAYETHGPLRRVEIGQDNVQGIDYTYTINGWLKAINNPSLEPTLDPGRDGKSGSSEAHALFGRDAFGMFLGYHTDDFKHTGSFADAATTTESSNTWHQEPLSSLYNGNIGAWQWGSRTSTGYKENLASRYRYDLLNRIRVDTLSTRVSNAWTATPNYRSSYTYDGNGNLKSLVRVDSAGTLMDSLVYRYQTSRNRLTHVDDPGGVAGNHSFDVDDQDTNTYTYDASGNMIGDTASGITAVVWTPSNKIQSITKGSTSKLEYTYDAMGNRVVKRYYQPTSTLKSTTWYARDAQGNILSVYERPHADSAIKQSEVHIYGSSRLGIEQRGITYGTSNYAWIGSEQHRNAGSKRYELTDHLGNVRVTISDLLIARPTGFGDTTQDAEVIDRRDYYPFGMEMPGRRWRASGEDAARFGFNGKENDNEVKGEGNQQDYGFRIYDPRIARFLSVDPLSASFASLTPYQYASLNPVYSIDLDGLEGVSYREGRRNQETGEFVAIRRVIALNVYVATGAGPNALSYPDEFNLEAYINNTFNEGNVTDEAGLPVVYRISVTKVNAESVAESEQSLQRAHSHFLAQDYESSNDVQQDGATLETSRHFIMYRNPLLVDADGRTVGAIAAISARVSNYLNGERETHEIVHRLLQGAGLSNRAPNVLSENAQHALGGAMANRVDTYKENGELESTSYDPKINPATHAKIIESVPRIGDKDTSAEP